MYKIEVYDRESIFRARVMKLKNGDWHNTGIVFYNDNVYMAFALAIEEAVEKFDDFKM